jgi:hypothetical protein
LFAALDEYQSGAELEARMAAWLGGGYRGEVLVGNTAGVAFWRAVGFRDYCVTLELEQL